METDNWAAARAAKPKAQHGSAGKYNNGCRCSDCRAGKSERNQAYHVSKGRIPTQSNRRKHDDTVDLLLECLHG